MTNHAKLPLYIAVQIENSETRARMWLTLPVTKERFTEALEQIGAAHSQYAVVDYCSTVPDITPYILMRSPLSAVNHLAARLEKLKADEIIKLCAVTDMVVAIGAVARMIEFTYHTDDITLSAGATDEEVLGKLRLNDLNQGVDAEVLLQCVDARKFGEKLAEAENGYFTPWGYITSKRNWDFLRPTPRLVPPTLNVKGFIGEDLYGVIDEGDFDYGNV